MRKANGVWAAAALGCAVFAIGATAARGQEAAGTGTLEFTAYVSPTAAKPEPVRDFTFYVLTKSYSDIKRELEEKNGSPDRERFVSDLKLSPELKEWLKAHEVLDLTMPGLDKQLTADDILHVPEFLLAYQRSNSGRNQWNSEAEVQRCGQNGAPGTV
ncbi:MAG TPA: hypothetical protein VKT53_08065 [Candidatus Acidoferrum sp.]|nr:hypothetical protein [Candidatus Acidoferrum sp.]